jgi:uncharacterized protein YdhG (YjbR/CyaY superfamily)
MLTIDSYLKNQEPPQAAALENVRTIIHRTAPLAEEGIAHTIPAFIYKGHPLIGFAAHPGYLGIYTFRPDVVSIFKDRLEGFELESRVIQFNEDRPVPDDVLEDVVRHLMHLIDAA